MIETLPEALKEMILFKNVYVKKTSQNHSKTLINNIDQSGLKLCHYPTLPGLKDYVATQKQTGKPLLKHFYDCDDLNLYF